MDRVFVATNGRKDSRLPPHTHAHTRTQTTKGDDTRVDAVNLVGKGVTDGQGVVVVVGIGLKERGSVAWRAAAATLTTKK